MKALILCAGKGTRLRPLTFTNAKPLIPIANKPTIVYSLEMIKEAGITEVGIVVNPDNKKDFEATLGTGEQLGLNITYIVQEEPKGLAHAVAISEDFLKDDEFLMYLGDNLVTVDLKKFVEEFNNENMDSFILLTPVEDPSRFGIAVLKDNKVIKVVEKPKDPPSDLAIIGVYIFKPVVFEAIKNIKPSWRGELEITDAIQWLLDNEKNVGAHIIYGWWKDTGKPEDLIEANRKILEQLKDSRNEGIVYENSSIHGNVVIGKGARILNSVLRGPIIIGDNVLISDSYIGPYTSIGTGVTIENAEIENSIILDNATIAHLETRLDSSIIGANATVVHSDRKPKTIRLVVGDYSKIEIPR
ncbi:glucose-1-phosphate thymidylyltransferase [Marinitoga sp. 1135]|uniref:Glucose-1-phosphate thymidylylransferase, long form n=1 Tax=Marinitoga piezophila (strain DSM 14283 / JCM 11233 / KA3) TaxID=443254 RepID=H2J6B2_MARPK|nr:MULTISPECIES: glucose-1-phosphate thymidylyltransferase [Marinitoga]AEX86260.1 glucose-1-phosphate thymidylylransferase, long form [Marinitoga piezophila KA3]APT76668.1 glucose-1-phosphate thymidylyltransferase [Marinitoga sp. 1137]NUU96439.1 glucose-1-phosphate thymidylyltransferase [Marinitoga sp. 1135]NUU98360.1 glucose-1-phosphate thymidylyltransferase [Marinitoga sp. 1138]